MRYMSLKRESINNEIRKKVTRDVRITEDMDISLYATIKEINKRQSDLYYSQASDIWNNLDKEQKRINAYDQQDEFDNLLASLKHNICQNMRIARKLSNMEPDQAAELLKLEPQSLRRIEAENDRDEFSTRVLILAIMIYEPDANFYFKKWQENELLLTK